MKFPFALSISLLALSTSASPVPGPDKTLEARQFWPKINPGKVDRRCTLSCSTWNICRADDWSSLQESCGDGKL